MRIDSIILHSIYNYNFMLKQKVGFDTLDKQYVYNLSSRGGALPPDYTNVKTMALMSYNAYLELNDTNWEKVPYNITKPINNDLDNVRGYLFKKDNVNIIAIKGTTINFVPDAFAPLRRTELVNNTKVIKDYYTFNQEAFNNPTVKNDRFNDNMFFSCCYYKQSKDYIDYLNNNTVCHTERSKKICNKSCYTESTNIELNYINIITSIIENMKKDINFDTETVVFTGHSLGGFLATVLGMKYNKQVISFDSPGTRHYINLLNLQGNTEQIYHFSHTADSIAHGHCGVVCKIWGYNLDTECHIGNTCIYDSKKKLGYFDGIRYHQLKWIIDYILPHWETDFPECVYNKECKERNCEKWEYD